MTRLIVYIRTILGVLLLGSCFTLVSCHSKDAAIEEDNQTGLVLRLVDAKGFNLVDMAKAMPQDLPLPLAQNFTMRIVNTTTRAQIYDGGFVVDRFAIKAGCYDIAVAGGSTQSLALDAPRYAATAIGVEVVAGQSKSLTLNCIVSNALASVQYQDPVTFAQYFTSYGIEVKVGSNQLWCEASTLQHPYFDAGVPVSFVFKGVRADNGQNYQTTIATRTFEAADHYKINLTLKGFEGALLDISINTEVETVSVVETLPLEWLPRPVVTAEGFDADSTLTMVETTDPAPVAIHLAAATPIQDILLTLDLEDEQLASQLNGQYLMSSLTEQDQQRLEAAGLTLPALGGTQATLTLTAFVAQLGANAEGVATTNRIAVAVKANNRWSNEAQPAASYTVVVQSPQFATTPYDQ